MPRRPGDHSEPFLFEAAIRGCICYPPLCGLFRPGDGQSRIEKPCSVHHLYELWKTLAERLMVAVCGTDLCGVSATDSVQAPQWSPGVTDWLTEAVTDYPGEPATL